MFGVLGWLALAALVSANPVGETSQPADEPIAWSVVDRFRLFDRADGPARERIDRLLDRLAASDEPARLETEYGALLRTLSGRDAATLRRSHWSPERRRYGESYLRPPLYRVEARLKTAPSGLCTWLVDGEVQHEDTRCDAPQRLELVAGAREGRWGGYGEVTVRRQDGQLVALQPIEVADRLIVALGDSFVSGEGNPDVPADFSGLAPGPRFQRVEWAAAIDPLRDGVTVAQWWDEPCHRSLLSWPVLAALKTSADHPREATTLISFACSGATVAGGLLGPQTGLPGCPDDRRAERRTCPPGRAEVAGQVAQLRTLLGESPTDRPIDRLYLSIGGNDIGFVGVIGYGLLPPSGYTFGNWIAGVAASEQGLVCPFEEADGYLRRFCGNRASAQARLAALPSFYNAVSEAFLNLGVDPKAVVQAQYPDILRDERAEASAPVLEPSGINPPDFALCHHALLSTDNEGKDEDEAEYREDFPWRLRPHGFEATQSAIPPLFRGPRAWSFQYRHPAGQPCRDEIDPGASEVCKSLWVWNALNKAVAANAARDWTIARDHVLETRGHGWCRANDEHPLALPISRRLPDGDWVWARYSAESPQDTSTFDTEFHDPRGPGDFLPYAEDRPRWFRTSNDSFMTQYGGPGRIIQGTVHPTFRAHVAYAESVLRAKPNAPLP